MPVVQDTFYIPDDIATGLATGLYRRIGSVVRYAVGPNKGKIIKHLKPVDLQTAEEAHGLGIKALQFVKQHKKGTIITIVGATAVGASVWLYNKIFNSEPKVVNEFRVELRAYIDAIRSGNMSIEKINSLMNALEELKKHRDYEEISIQLTTEELSILVGRIYEYTIKLAKDNDVELNEDALQASWKNNSRTIINLQNCLRVQKKIFEEAA